MYLLVFIAALSAFVYVLLFLAVSFNSLCMDLVMCSCEYIFVGSASRTEQLIGFVCGHRSLLLHRPAPMDSAPERAAVRLLV